MAPPVPVIGREVQESLDIPGIGTIPAKTNVFMNIYSMHHNPHVWGEDRMVRPQFEPIK